MKPAIDIPYGIDPALRKTLEAIKENLEIITGRRQGRTAAITNTKQRWEDQLAPLSAAKSGGGAGTTPVWSVWRNSIYAWEFGDAQTDELWVTIHITHLYKPGTPIYLHVHWGVKTAVTGTVRWGIEYTVAKGHQQQVFPATTTVYIEQALPSATAANNQYMHMIAEMSEAQAIQPSVGVETGSVILVRLFRDATNANDTISAGVHGFLMDAHFEVDGNFTTTKAPNWVKNEDYTSASLAAINSLIDQIQ